jgi:hypothetical protein
MSSHGVCEFVKSYYSCALIIFGVLHRIGALECESTVKSRYKDTIGATVK